MSSNILHPEDSSSDEQPDLEAIILQNRGKISSVNNNKASSVLMLDDVEDDDIVNQNSSRGE